MSQSFTTVWDLVGALAILGATEPLRESRDRPSFLCTLDSMPSCAGMTIE